MPVRIARGDIEVIQNFGLLDQVGGSRYRKLGEQLRHYMPPSLLTQMEVKRFHCQFSRLLSSEASPFMPAVFTRCFRLFDISLCLDEPVIGAVRHKGSITEIAGFIQDAIQLHPPSLYVSGLALLAVSEKSESSRSRSRSMGKSNIGMTPRMQKRTGTRPAPILMPRSARAVCTGADPS